MALSATRDGDGAHERPVLWSLDGSYIGVVIPPIPPASRISFTCAAPFPPSLPVIQAARHNTAKKDGGLRVRPRPEPPVRPGPGEHPGPRHPRHEPPERGLPLAGLARPHQDPPRGRQEDLQDHHRHPFPHPDHRDGRVGERADEHAVPWRPHRVVPDGAVQPAVDRPAAAPGLRRGRGGERLGPGRRPRRPRGQAPPGHGPHHQGHRHRPQRDRHRRHQQPRHRPQAPRSVHDRLQYSVCVCVCIYIYIYLYADTYRHPALILVDGVSSICALDFRMDEWGVDVALTGSQKALSMPTGLGIVCASPKALEASKTAKSLRVFFDWKDYLKHYKLGTYWPYTPSIQLLYGLRAALDLLFLEGLDNVFKRHKRFGTATRLAVEAWGLKNCTQKEEWFSDTVTAVVVPPYIDSGEIVKHAWKRYNLSLGLGLNKVAGKVFRIGHLGNLNELQLLGCLSGVEMVLKDVGYPVKLGSGVAAAAAYLSNSTPLIPSRI